MIEQEKTRLESEGLTEGFPFLKQILQNIKQVVWLLDLSTDQILFVSPAFEDIWGRTRESLYADPFTLIQSVHPEDRVKVMSASPGENRKSLSQTYRILRPDGSLRWISADIFLIRENPRLLPIRSVLPKISPIRTGLMRRCERHWIVHMSSLRSAGE